MKQFSIILGLAALIWAAAWYQSEFLAGDAPVTRLAIGSDEATRNDPVLNRLRAALDTAPTDKDILGDLGEALFERIRGTQEPSDSLLLETIDVLSQLKEVDPGSNFATFGLAEIAFIKQIFPEAAKYYAEYLVNNPDDEAARARYGSALTFTGEYKKAEAELRKVIEKNPKSFQGHAFLSITYAQMEDMAKAVKFGEQALALAPDTEGKEKFGAFLDTLRNRKDKGSEANSAPDKKTEQGGVGSLALVEFVKKNPVAGAKLTGYKESPGTIQFLFKEFPMDKMPEFAKAKFVSGISAEIKRLGLSDLKEVVFVDEDSGKPMHSMKP